MKPDTFAFSDERPRIIYLSQLFNPEPTFKGLDFIKEIESRGLSVEVVTGFPNYPGGKIYKGYAVKALLREMMDGVSVSRVAVYPSHDRSALKRLFCYASFSATSLFYLLFKATKSDLVYVYYPSLTAGLSAAIAKLFRRTPIILDIQDMWPDSLGASGMVRNSLILGVTGFLCSLLYRACDHIIVLSPGFRNLLVQRGVRPEKITTIYNWADESVVAADSMLPAVFDRADNFRVLFAGNMGAAQGLDTVLEAARMLADRKVDCTFYFMGDGVECAALKKAASDGKLANIRFISRVPLDEVQTYLKAADALLVHLRDEPLFRITIPSKTQAYLYAGRPILMGVRGDAGELVEKSGAGYTFEPQNPVSLAARIEDMIVDGPEKRREMGISGSRFYQQFLSKKAAIDLTVELIMRFRTEKNAGGGRLWAQCHFFVRRSVRRKSKQL